jgi:hypothetical protein
VYDDLRAHFEQGVVGAYVEYLGAKESHSSGTSLDLRRAITAALALYHFREHIPSRHRKPVQTVRQQCPAYAILNDVANAAKHNTLRRRRARIAAASQVKEVWVRTQYQDDLGSYCHIEKTVVVSLSRGQKLDLLEIMTEVMNYWCKELHNIGVLASAKSWPYPLHSEPRLRSQSNNGHLDLEFTRGLRFKQEMQIKRYNYETRQLEAVDLTGWQSRFRLYAPRYEVLVTITENGTGRRISQVVTLSAEESRKLDELQSDEERQRYISGLDRIGNALKELVGAAKEDSSLLDGSGPKSLPSSNV